MDHLTLDARIAELIATHEGVGVTDLNPPLYDEIDVEALEKLLCPRADERTEFVGVVTFDYCELTVTVDQAGTITVTSPGGRRSTTESTTDRPKPAYV